MLNKRTMLAVLAPIAAAIAAAPTALAHDGAFTAPGQPPAAAHICFRITVALPSPWVLFADRPARVLAVDPGEISMRRCVTAGVAPPSPIPSLTTTAPSARPGPIENQGPGSGAYTPTPAPIATTSTSASTPPTMPMPMPMPPTTTTTTPLPASPTPIENQGPGSGAYIPNPSQIASSTPTSVPSTTVATPGRTPQPRLITGSHW
jgi:hypothetical protein